jgi:hypothetical protein
MTEAPLPGPLDDFLSSAQPRSQARALREEVLAKTTRVVRRRRAARRLVLAGSLAAAVVLGAAIGWVCRPAPQEQVPQLVEKKAPIPPREEAPPPLKQPVPDDIVEVVLSPALAKEWQAFDAPPAQRVPLLFEAGDRYVADDQDFASALRCYRQALDLGGEDTLEVRPTDNWLVMALKIDRQKEH